MNKVDQERERLETLTPAPKLQQGKGQHRADVELGVVGRSQHKSDLGLGGVGKGQQGADLGFGGVGKGKQKEAGVARASQHNVAAKYTASSGDGGSGSSGVDGGVLGMGGVGAGRKVDAAEAEVEKAYGFWLPRVLKERTEEEGQETLQVRGAGDAAGEDVWERAMCLEWEGAGLGKRCEQRGQLQRWCVAFGCRRGSRGGRRRRGRRHCR